MDLSSFKASLEETLVQRVCQSKSGLKLDSYKDPAWTKTGNKVAAWEKLLGAVEGEFGVERLGGDTQDAGGLGLVAAGGFEGSRDRLALGFC